MPERFVPAGRALAALLSPFLAPVLALVLVAAAGFATAKEAAPAALDPALEARMLRITAELRCLVCQNQTIADSNADLAVDLRRETRELLLQGKSDREVVDYMTARYGDFVLYRPPLKSSTALLWFGPAAMLVVGASALVLVLRRRSRLADDAFEPDENDPGEATSSADEARAAVTPTHAAAAEAAARP